MAKTIDLLKEFEAASSLDRTALERVRLDASETALIFFTTEAEELDLHYCREPDLNDYIACNGPGCVLCTIRREKVTRRLLPVYLPAAHAVGVLPVGTSLRPRSLGPQLVNILKDGSRKAVFVSRVQGDSYAVTSAALPDDVEDGTAAIKAFLEDYDKGLINLDSVFPKATNEQLAAIPEIAAMLKLKGLQIK